MPFLLICLALLLVPVAGSTQPTPEAPAALAPLSAAPTAGAAVAAEAPSPAQAPMAAEPPAPTAEAEPPPAAAEAPDVDLRQAGWETCLRQLPDVTSARAISACSWLIDQHREAPSNLAVALFTRGNERRLLGQHEAALQDFTAALALVPDDAAALLNRAIVRRALGDRARALVDLNAALKLAPGNANVLANRCITRRRLGEGDPALADCDAAVAQAEPQNGFPLVARAGLALRRGMERPAAADIAEVLRRIPEADKALRLRAVLHARHGEAAAARADIAAAEALNPRVGAEIVEIFGAGLLP